MSAVLSARGGRQAAAGRASARISRMGPISILTLGLLRLGLGAVLRRPGYAFAGAALILVAASIAYNALALQRTRHPAPIFSGKGRPDGATKQAESAPAPLASGQPVLAWPTSPSPAAAPVPKANPTSIGDLIRAEATGSTEIGRNEGHTVAAAQRALSKLGYGPIKADGVLGPGTRQAIERFERDRRLPVTGELGPRTVRELVARSGLVID